MKPFDFACSVIDRVKAAKTIAVVLNEVGHAARHFGLERVIVAGVPAAGKRLEPYVLANNWPQGWYERYNVRDYLHTDPVIRKLRTTTSPVVWTEAPYDPSSDKNGHAVMCEAREFSLNNGLSVPIYTLSGDQAAVSFGGSHFELSVADKHALHLIAIYTHNTAASFRPQAKKPPPPKLSPREIEIFQWVAAGLSSQDISERLHIAYTTVESHVQNACRKLDYTSRTQALAEAFRHQLLR